MEAETAQLDEMRNAAHALGVAFAQAAQAETDLDRKLTLFDAFQRSFASVRLSIALALRLRQDVRRTGPIETERADTEHLETEPAERPERDDERDRDREAERATFPLLMRTLGRVADDAEALLPQAAELPTLRELLHRVAAQPAPPARPPAATPLRARLSSGAATLTLSPSQRLSGLVDAPPRRSTGPPRR